MRILLIILLFLTTKVYAEELTGLFGIKFAENYQGLGVFDINIIQETDSVEKLNALKKYYKTPNRYRQKIEVKPININKNFDKYYIVTSPLSGVVLRIYAEGKYINEENECNYRMEFYERFFIEKYNSSYSIEINKLQTSMRFDFFKKEISNDSISSFNNYAAIIFNCEIGYLSGYIEDSDILQKFESEEIEKILNMINLRINELTIKNDDTDSTGL